MGSLRASSPLLPSTFEISRIVVLSNVALNLWHHHQSNRMLKIFKNLILVYCNIKWRWKVLELLKNGIALPFSAYGIISNLQSNTSIISILQVLQLYKHRKLRFRSRRFTKPHQQWYNTHGLPLQETTQRKTVVK